MKSTQNSLKDDAFKPFDLKNMNKSGLALRPLVVMEACFDAIQIYHLGLFVMS